MKDMPWPNELDRVDEVWRPLPFISTGSPRRRIFAFFRRLFDLQAASIWIDLKEMLVGVQGLVVDVGAGAQPYRDLFSPGAVYQAFDISDAEKQFGYRVTHTHTHYFDGDTWPVASGTVDLVLSTETLEHVMDPGRFLDEAKRVLRKQGQLILTVPFAARWHYVPQDFWRFTPSGLRVLLERHGFAQIYVHARGNALTVAMLKFGGLILPMLLPTGGKYRWTKRVPGLLFSPLLIVIAALGQLSLRASGGTDCLGYTVSALRRDDQ